MIAVSHRDRTIGSTRLGGRPGQATPRRDRPLRDAAERDETILVRWPGGEVPRSAISYLKRLPGWVWSWAAAERRGTPAFLHEVPGWRAVAWCSLLKAPNAEPDLDVGVQLFRTATIVSLALGIVALGVWAAAFAESVVPATTCTVARMRVESYLLMARAVAMVLPVVGLVLAWISHRAGRRAVWAAGLNGIAVLYVIGVLARVLPVNHFACLRS